MITDWSAGHGTSSLWLQVGWQVRPHHCHGYRLACKSGHIIAMITGWLASQATSLLWLEVGWQVRPHHYYGCKLACMSGHIIIMMAGWPEHFATLSLWCWQVGWHVRSRHHNSDILISMSGGGKLASIWGSHYIIVIFTGWLACLFTLSLLCQLVW